MTDTAAARAVEMLLSEGGRAYVDGRYAAALSAAERAVRAATYLDDTNLLLRALDTEANALSASGDNRAALARYTHILSVAEAPAVTARLDTVAARIVARAYTGWVSAAIYTGGVRVRELFGVLDAADRWLTAIGHPNWRAPVLLHRALLHNHLGEWERAVDFAQEALAAYHPGAPGASLANHRLQLSHALRDAGRPAEAEPLLQAVLDDPSTAPRERSGAWAELAHCALARDDPDTATRHAHSAVQLAEPFGGELVLIALSVLVAAHRAAGHLDEAAEAAFRRLDAARRVGTHYRLHYALLDVFDVALDRGDHPTATALLDELDRHADVLDTDTRGTLYRDAVAERHARITSGH